MSNQPTPTISVITATYNAAAVLPRLIESLAAQTDQDFEWVVADGGSTDGTLEILEKAKSQLKNVIIDSRPDFGIYDALNRAVKLSSGEYYVVMGADDEFFPNAIADYREACLASKADFVTCRAWAGSKLLKKRKYKWDLIFNQNAHVAGHAVVLLIKKNLHQKVGFYSRSYPIAADHFFIALAIKNNATVFESNAIVGRYSIDGLSSADIAGALTEDFRVNLRLGENFIFLVILLSLRLIKNKSKILTLKL